MVKFIGKNSEQYFRIAGGVDMTAIVIVKAPPNRVSTSWGEDCRYEPSPQAT